VFEHDDDVMRTSLRYDLSPSDYSLILQTSVPRVLEGLSNPQAAALLQRLNTDRTDPLSARLAKLILLTIIDKISHTCELEGLCPALLPFANDQDKSVVTQALRILVRLRCGPAAPYLISRLDPDRPIQTYSAIKDLVQINAVSAAEHIAPLLDAPDSSTRYWAMWAIVQFDARQYHKNIFELVERYRGRDSIEVDGIAVLVKWDDPRAIPMAMEWLKSGDLYRRNSMADRLEKLGADQIVGALIEFLHDQTILGGDRGTNANIRRDAMGLLARLDPNGAVPTLREFARNKHDFLVMEAVQELGRIRAKEAVPELVGLVSRGRASRTVILALARIGEPNTIPIVLAELRKSQPNASHVTTLFDLNVASDPVTYHRLQTTKFEYAQAYPVDQALKHFELWSGMPAVLTDRVDPADSSRMVASFAKGTLPAGRVLDRILNMLNYSGHKYSVFINDGVINVATIPEIYDLWQQWLQAQGLGPSENVGTETPVH
jgi:HEAT repeat protein